MATHRCQLPNVAPATPMCNALKHPRLLAAAAFRHYTQKQQKQIPRLCIVVVAIVVFFLGFLLLSPLALQVIFAHFHFHFCLLCTHEQS